MNLYEILPLEKELLYLYSIVFLYVCIRNYTKLYHQCLH